MDEKTYMRCKCCGSFIEKEKPKQHPLDEFLNEIVEQHLGSLGKFILYERLKELRYESIKWAWETDFPDTCTELVHKQLKKQNKEHWIVEE